MHHREDAVRKFAAPVGLSIFLGGALTAAPARAACVDGTGNDVPCLKIDIPTVQFTKFTSTDKAGFTTIDVPYLAQYINGVYQYGTYAAIIVASVMTLVGGFEWLTAGDSGRSAKGKERIVNSMIGLVLVLGAYVILNTVDPRITMLKGLSIDVIKGIPLSIDNVEEQEQPDLTNAGTTAVQMTPISGTGISGKIRFNAENSAGLLAAAADLNAKTGHSMMGGGERSLSDQVKFYENRCIAGKLPNTTIDNGRTECKVPTCNPYSKEALIVNPEAGKTGKWIREGSAANANNCGHTSGKAIDVTCDSSTHIIHNFDAQCQMELERAMQAQGFCRLETEPWHFEKPKFSSNCMTTWTPGTFKERGEVKVYSDCEGTYNSFPETKGLSDEKRCTSFKKK